MLVTSTGYPHDFDTLGKISLIEGSPQILHTVIPWITALDKAVAITLRISFLLVNKDTITYQDGKEPFMISSISLPEWQVQLQASRELA